LRSKWAAGPALAGRSEPDWQRQAASQAAYPGWKCHKVKNL
jgi:hypothetical protein